jgi:hypothetical protein
MRYVTTTKGNVFMPGWKSSEAEQLQKNYIFAMLATPASNFFPATAAFCRYWQGLKKPENPAASNLLAQKESLLQM